LRSEIAGPLLGQRKPPLPQLHGAQCEGALARRLITLVGHDADVEGRISRPRLQNTMVKVQPVHLSSQDVEIDLLRDRPRPRIERGEPLSKAGESRLLRGHRCGRVVGDAVHQLWLLKRAPFGKEGNQVIVRGAGCGERSQQHARTAGEKRAHRHTGYSDEPLLLATRNSSSRSLVAPKDSPYSDHSARAAAG